MRILSLVVFSAFLSACACCRPTACCEPVGIASALAPEARPPTPEAVAPEQVEGPLYKITARFRTVGKGASLLSAPTLLVRPGQRATIRIGEEHSYIGDFDVEVVPGAMVSDPVIKTARDGLALEVVAQPVAGDTGAAWVAYQVGLAKVKLPMRWREVPLGRSLPRVQIQLPQVHQSMSAGVHRATCDAPFLLATLPATRTRGKVEVHVTVSAIGDVQAASEAGKTPAPNEPQRDELDFFGPTLFSQDLPALLAAAQADGAAHGRLHAHLVRLRSQPDDLGARTGAAAKALAQGARSLRRLTLSAILAPGATTRALTRRAYVQDMDVTVAGGKPLEAGAPLPKDSAVAYDPIIGHISAGLVLGISTVDGVAYVEVTSARMPPMPTFATRIEKGGPQVRIELPELRIARATLELKPGRWLLPLGRLKGGGTLAAWIDYTPDAAK